jgi:CPA2 family monovalent cation:H+ antiporter-2
MDQHVIIAGFGRVGQMLGRILSREGVSFVAVDMNARAIPRHRRDGHAVFYGDASRIEILTRNRAEAAAALVVTMDNWEASERLVLNARRQWPELRIYARARDQAHARRLLSLGATEAIPETLEASLKLGLSLLYGIGMPEEISLDLIDRERQSATDDLRA